MAYSARVGVTTNVDMGEFVEPGTRDMKDSFVFDGLASGDPFAMYEPFLALHREGKLSTRLRVFFLSMDQGQDFPMARERVLNAFDRFGDDMMRISGIGEFATSWPLFGPGVDAAQLSCRPAVHRRAWLVLPAAQSVAGRRPDHRGDLRGGQRRDADCEPALVRRPCAEDRPGDRESLQGASGPGSPSIRSAIFPIRPTPMPDRRCA